MHYRSLAVALVCGLSLTGCIPDSRTQVHAKCHLAANDRYPGVYEKLSVDERGARETHVSMCMMAAGYVWDHSDFTCQKGIPYEFCFKPKSIWARLASLIY